MLPAGADSWWSDSRPQSARRNQKKPVLGQSVCVCVCVGGGSEQCNIRGSTVSRTIPTADTSCKFGVSKTILTFDNSVEGLAELTEGRYTHTDGLLRERVQIKISQKGFPGGAVVKNPPANAGDMGSSPGPGRSHMPQSN